MSKKIYKFFQGVAAHSLSIEIKIENRIDSITIDKTMIETEVK